MKKNAVEIIAGIVILAALAVVAFVIVGNLSSKSNKTNPKTTVKPTTIKPTTKKPTTTKKTDPKPQYEYSITYDLDGGENNPNNPIGFNDGDTITLLEPTKLGYDFGGWYTSESYSGQPVTEITISTDYVLYAKFDIHEYAITYYNVDGLNNPNPGTYTINDSVITLSNVDRYSSLFKGWYTTSTFDPESKITEINPTSLKDYELYAEFEIIKSDPIVNVASKDLTYNALEQELLNVNVTGGTIYYSLDNENFSEEMPKGTNAGNYQIYYKVIGDEYHFDLLDQSIVATIKKATYDMSSVEFNDKSVTYNKNAQSITITGELPEGVTVAYENNEGTNVGTYDAVAKFSGDFDNYNTISNMTATLSITKATYDMSGVEFSDKSVTYTKNAQSITITGTLPEGVTVTYENNEGTNVGTYDAVAKFSGDFDNYEAISDMTATLSITKATYDMSGITFVGDEVTYDGNVHSLEINGTLPSGVTVEYENNNKTTVGTYTVTAKFSGDATNYELIDNMTATLTINKAVYDMSQVTFDDDTVVYDGEAHSILISGTLPSGVEVTYENNGKTTVGTYTIIAKFSGDATNYELIDNMTATLIISKKAYDMSGVEFNNKTVTYTGSSYSIEITGELPEGVTVSYENNGKINAGTYTITAKFVGDATNYELIPNKTAILTIEKAVYDIEASFLGDEVTYDGNVHSLVVSGTIPSGVTITYENNDKVNAGTYVVIAKFSGDENNYELISDMTASLIINKATYDMSGITFPSDEVIYNGYAYSLAIIGTLPSGVTVEYENNDKINVGTYTITAKFSGDEANYELIDNMTATLKINKATYDMSGVTFDGDTVTYDGNIHSLAISGDLPSGVTVEYENNNKTNYGTYTVIAKFSSNNTNYNDIDDMEAILIINKATATYTLPTAIDDLIYNENAQALVNTGSVSVGSIEYSLDGENWSNNIPTGTTPNTYNVSYRFVLNDNYEAIDGGMITVIIDKATIDMSNIALNDRTATYTGSSQTITISGTLNPNVTVNYTGEGTVVGTYDIKATFTVNTDLYYPIDELEATLTITPATIKNVTVTGYNAMLDHNAHDIVVSKNATTVDNSETTWLFSKNQEDWFTQMTVTDPEDSGTYYFKINADNHDEYIGHFEVVVTEKNVTTIEITNLSSLNKVYDGTRITSPIIYTNNGLGTVTITYSLDGTTFTDVMPINAGHYTIKVEVSETDTYAKASIQKTFDISKATYDMSGVIFEGFTTVYDGGSFSVVVYGTLPAGVTVTYEGNGQTNVGTYTVVAKFSGDYENYNEIDDMTTTFEIIKATYNMSGVEFNDDTVTYDGNVHSLAISGTLPEGVTVSYDNNDKVNAGTYEVTAVFNGDYTNYNVILDKFATLKINKATYDMSGVAFNDSTIPYDGLSHKLTISGTLPIGVSVTYSDTASYTAVGEYEYTASFSGDEANYELIDSMTATLTIEKATIDTSVVEFNDLTVTYDGLSKSITATNIPDHVSVEYTENGKTNAGTYTVTVTFIYDNDCYNVTVASKTATLTINKKEIDTSVVVFSDLTVTYDKTNKSILATNVPTNITVEYTGNGKKNAGTYTVTATFVYDTDNYTVTVASKTATLTIEKATINMSEVTFNNGTFTYDGNVKSIAVSDNLPEEITGVTYTNNNKVNAGIYTVTASFEYDTDNYNTVSDMTATLTINKKEIDNSNIELPDATYTYDGSVKSLAYTGVLPSGISGVNYTGNNQTNAGIYDVVMTFNYDTTNYTVTVLQLYGTLTIEKATINMSGVTFNNGSFTYDGSAKSIYVSSNLPEEITNVNYTNNGQVNAGTYTVTASFVYDTDNYNEVSNITATLTINKATIDTSVVVFNNLTVDYDGTSKSITATNFPTGVTATYTGNGKINAGTYTVTATFVYDNDNYEVTVASKTATLKINKINPTYTVPTNLKACVGSTLASVTLPAGFTWNDPTTTSVGAVGNNNFTVTYTPDDTTNYNVIDDIVVTIAVQEKYVIICENNQSSDYSATQQGPVVTVKLNNIVVTENYTLSYAYKLTSASTYTNGLPTNAGEYNIKINCSGTEGYNADEVIVNFKIKKVKLTITSPNIALNYSSSARTWASIAEAIKPLITYSGLLAGDETTTTVLGMHNGKYKYGSVSGSYIAPTSDTIFGSSYTNVIGSTYSVFVSQSNENYELNEYTIVLKYKTALIGSTYYTIEDAISATGTITFAGDSSAAQTYVATTFSSLDTSITGYSTSYTLSNRTLFIPYTNNTSINNKPTNAGSGNAQGNVYTSLIVPEHITINMNNSSNLVIDANVLYSQSYSSTWSNIRGVIVNDGIINLSSSKLYAYGYLKGNGTLNLTNNSSAIDLLDLFDFSGGTIASDIYTKCLPFTAWTLNNISCNAYYYSGSTLTGYSHAILSYVGEQTGSALIIGTTNSSNALFMPLTISNSNYIVKYASPSVTNKNSDTAALRSITGNNQKKGIKQIVEINGNYKDNTVSVSIQVTISTSTSKSLPISYLSIILKNNSVLNISQSDYLFLPGTSLTVEEGATLNVGADVDIALLPWSYFSSTYNFYNNCIDKVDPKIINNGSITFNGNVGGHITTEISGAQLNISGGVKASYTMYYTTGEGDHYEIKNSSTTLYLYNGIANENQLKTLSNGSSFYSIKDDNNVYGFYATSGTISYITNGGKESYSPKNIAIGKNGYTITNSDLPQNPTRDYYTFEGWYIDNSFNTLALGYKIYSGIELYAKWNLIDYTINYIDVYNSSPSGGSYTNSNPTSFNYETNVLFIEPTNGDYVFGGWYVDELCTNRIHMLTGSSLVSYLSDNSINIYISWYSEGTSKYVITFVNTNEDITCPSYDSIIGDGYDWSSYVLPVMSQNDNNYEVPIYFGGWYMNDTLINVLNEDLFELNSTTGCYELTLTTHWKDKNCLTVKAFTFVLATVYYKSGYSFTIPSLESKGITLGQEGLVLINWQSDNGTTYNSGDIITLIDQTEINAYIVTFVKLEIGLNDYTTVTVTLTSGQGYIVNYNETTGVSTATPFTGQTKSNGSETYITTGSIFKARYTAAQDSRNNSAKITGTTPTTDLKTSDQTYTATSSDISIKPEGEESCLAPGSLITMADGTQKAVEDIKLYDLVLTWNFFTGEYQVMPVISIEKRTNVVCNLATITLENGYQIKIINSQSFFDYDTKQYFVIDLDNPDMYIGRNIAITDETGFTSSRIANITVEKTTSDTYELLTAYNLNVIADGMLTTSPYVVYYNFFEIDENNMINMDVLSQDIETYGLFTYDEWSQYISQEAFDVVMVAYLKIAIGKGYATYDDILRVCMLYLTTEAV